MRQESATRLAQDAIVWLAGHDTLLPIFLGSTGAGLDDFKNGLEDTDFMSSVLDFILLDDAWITEFAGANGVSPQEVMAARHALPGGAPVHWT